MIVRRQPILHIYFTSENVSFRLWKFVVCNHPGGSYVSAAKSCPCTYLLLCKRTHTCTHTHIYECVSQICTSKTCIPVACAGIVSTRSFSWTVLARSKPECLPGQRHGMVMAYRLQLMIGFDTINVFSIARRGAHSTFASPRICLLSWSAYQHCLCQVLLPVLTVT